MKELAKKFISVASWVGRHPFSTFFMFVLIAVFFGLQASKLRVRSDYAELLPSNYPSVVTLKKIMKKVGSLGNLIIVIESDDFEASKKFAADITKVLKKKPFVKYIDYQFDASFFKDHALLYTDLETLRKIRHKIKERIIKEKQKRNPLYFSLDDDEEDEDDEIDFGDVEKKYLSKVENVKSSGYYATPDGKVMLVVIRPVGSLTDVANSRRILKMVRNEIKKLNPSKYHPSMKVGLSGTFRNKVDEYNAVMRDLKFSATFAAIGVTLLLILYFRQLFAPFFIVMPLFMALSVTFGITYWVIGSLNTITSFLIAVLMGLGIDYGIHVYARFQEERLRGHSTKEALETSLKKLVRASATAAATTIVAFYSLILTDFKGFRHFGFIAGTGIFLTFLSYFTVFPCLVLIADKLHLLKFKGKLKDKAVLERRKMPLAGPFLLVGGAFTLVSILCLPALKFEYDFSNLKMKIPAHERLKKKVGLVFKGSLSPAIIIAEDRRAQKEIVRILKNIQEKDKETPTIASVRSLYELIPENQRAKLKEIRRIRKLLNDDTLNLIKDKEKKKKIDEFKKLASVRKPITVKDLPPAVLNKFRGEDGSLGDFIYVLPSVQLRDGRAAIRFAEDVAVVKTAYGTYYASSDAVIFADMLRAMAHDGKRALSYTFLAVFLILWIDRRNFLQAVLIMTPLTVGVLWMIGVMALFGIKLNFLNAVVLPSIIGIAVDHGVHIYHRYRAEGVGSLALVIRRTGGAVFLSSLTTILGFSGLLFATHPGLRSIGLLAVIGMTTTLISAMVFMPSMLQVLEDRRKVLPLFEKGHRPVSKLPSALVMENSEKGDVPRGKCPMGPRY